MLKLQPYNLYDKVTDSHFKSYGTVKSALFTYKFINLRLILSNIASYRKVKLFLGKHTILYRFLKFIRQSVSSVTP